MIVTIGDLVEDVVVRLGGPVHLASDTSAVVVRRRGGSAANMAAAVVRAGGAARFVGQVGDDPAGETLVGWLADEGVDVVVRRAGRSGTVVVLVDHLGERTMLSDRAACADLDGADPAWLDGASTLHVPVYSLLDGALAATAAACIADAHGRGLRVSIDASSSAVLEAYGLDRVRALLRGLRPDVLLCNEDEAAVLGGDDGSGLASCGAGVVVVKRGAGTATAWRDGRSAVAEVAAHPIAAVRDTTGAGDGFAAGLLLALERGEDLAAALHGGHDAARSAIERAGGPISP